MVTNVVQLLKFKKAKSSHSEYLARARLIIYMLFKPQRELCFCNLYPVVLYNSIKHNASMIMYRGSNYEIRK